MLGNDVVDLEDPETRPETFRPRFDERVFDPTERRAIARDQNEHGRRWTHWAAKEAAYKLARQVDSKFVFSPSKLVARFTEDVDVASGVRERRGTLDLPEGLLSGDQRVLQLFAEERDGYVHVVAIPGGADRDAIVHSISTVDDQSRSSEIVREMATAEIARNLGIEAARVAIGKRGRVPRVLIDAAPSAITISLSHHGRFIASAFSITSEAESQVGSAVSESTS
jgi:phosphopantetheinyl transferase (holo-ACP synthase)